MHLPTLFFLSAAVGIAGGYAAGGRLRGLVSLPRSLLLVPWLAAFLQFALALTSADSTSRWALTSITYLLVAVLVGLGWRACRRMVSPSLGRVAVAILVIGWAMNTAVVAANGGMPVSRDALASAGYERGLDVTNVSIRKHVAASDEAKLLFLGDVIPVRPLKRVVSAGDIALLSGLSLFVAAAMGPRRLGDHRPVTA
jgi:Family of unknown function (DUF5317)